MSIDRGSLPRKRDTGTTIYSGVPTIEYHEERREKPWQRVLTEVTRKGSHLYEPVKAVPSPVFVLLLGIYLLLAYFTQLNEDAMPTVIKDADISSTSTDTFSEEAAWRYLNTILGDEPRVAGLPYHLQKTQDLKQLLDSVVSRNPNIRTDWQFADGDYWLSFAIPHVNVYKNSSNIIAILEGETGFNADGTTGTSLLVNCHYDSVPFAMGASDNAIFCAVMMETLSRLSRRTQKFKHNVIFLFNGAEENPLHGSHAFLKHPWAKGITNVVNLDAAGMNGKPIVFQVSDPRVMGAYQRTARRPSGQSIGEFLFKTGIIPSDTDFRIWRDFGHFHGIDIAFVKWGHVYHTRYDHPDLVHAGVIQNAGDMMLGVITELADMTELDTQIEPTASVYYDYLYWFMIEYSFSAAVAVDVCVALFALLSVAYYVWLVGYRWSTILELLLSAISRLLCVGCGITVCAILVPISIATTIQMRYLTQPWIVVPLYWLPYIVTVVCVSQLFDAWRAKKTGLNRSIRTLQAQASTRAMLAILLLILTCIPSLTTLRYLLTVPLFLMSLFALVSLTVVRLVRLQAWQQLLMELLLSIPAYMFTLSLVLRFVGIMLPTIGRTATDMPDKTIAIINVGLAVLTCYTVSGIELLFSRKRLWLAVSALSIISIVFMFIPVSPWQDDGPSTQRHYWFHSETISYDINNQITSRTSGVLVTKHDAYSTSNVLSALRSRNINMATRDDFADDCERFVNCNLPLFRVRFGSTIQQSLMLTTGPPTEFEASMVVTSRNCLGETCALNFTMTGPPHNMFTLWPYPNVNISSWSFASAAQFSFVHRDRLVYVLIHSEPTYSGSSTVQLNFTVNFIVPLSQQSQPVVDVSLHSHKIHHPNEFTTEYRNLLDAMPRYFHINSFLSRRKNYVF